MASQSSASVIPAFLAALENQAVLNVLFLDGRGFGEGFFADNFLCCLLAS